MTTTLPVPSSLARPVRGDHRSRLAARRARIRRGQDAVRLDAHAWATLHWRRGPFPNPTVMWGLGDDGDPVILELDNPSAGPLVVMAEAGHANLIAALLLSLSWLNQPEMASAHIITTRPETWGWAEEIPHLEGISHPGDGGLEDSIRCAYQDDRYLLVLADGDAAVQALPEHLLETGPDEGLWPMLFCSPLAGLDVASVLAASGLPYTPIQGHIGSAVFSTDRHLLLPDNSLALQRPGKAWTTTVKGRIVRFTLP